MKLIVPVKESRRGKSYCHEQCEGLGRPSSGRVLCEFFNQMLDHHIDLHGLLQFRRCHICTVSEVSVDHSGYDCMPDSASRGYTGDLR